MRSASEGFTVPGSGNMALTSPSRHPISSFVGRLCVRAAYAVVIGALPVSMILKLQTGNIL